MMVYSSEVIIESVIIDSVAIGVCVILVNLSTGDFFLLFIVFSSSQRSMV